MFMHSATYFNFKKQNTLGFVQQKVVQIVGPKTVNLGIQVIIKKIEEFYILVLSLSNNGISLILHNTWDNFTRNRKIRFPRYFPPRR